MPNRTLIRIKKLKNRGLVDCMYVVGSLEEIIPNVNLFFPRGQAKNRKSWTEYSPITWTKAAVCFRPVNRV